MANLPESAAAWIAGIYQLEENDPVLGGEPDEGTGDGMSNIPHKQLADRTAFLKAVQDSLLDGSAFAKSLASLGYYTLPGGLILQWGSFIWETSTNGSGKTVTLPLAFPTAHFQTILSDTSGFISDGLTDEGTRVTALGLSSFTCFTAWSGGITMPSASPCRFFSIGI